MQNWRIQGYGGTGTYKGSSGMGGTGTVRDAAYQSHHLLHLFAGEVEEGLNEVTVEKALAGAPARVAFVDE